jgi:hypothetical protein
VKRFGRDGFGRQRRRVEASWLIQTGKERWSRVGVCGPSSDFVVVWPSDRLACVPFTPVDCRSRLRGRRYRRHLGVPNIHSCRAKMLRTAAYRRIVRVIEGTEGNSLGPIMWTEAQVVLAIGDSSGSASPPPRISVLSNHPSSRQPNRWVERPPIKRQLLYKRSPVIDSALVSPLNISSSIKCSHRRNTVIWLYYYSTRIRTCHHGYLPQLAQRSALPQARIPA